MAVEQTADNDWGVTVEEVSALAPHITIGEGPAAPVDAVFGRKADRAITVDEVKAWISDVAGRVALRLADLGRITDENRLNRIGKAAHDATVNGAASYLVAAAHPVGQVNSSEGYAAVLWARYEAALDGVGTVYDLWIGDLPKQAAAAQAGAASGYFPAPLFVDGVRF